jgi:hypothetical protein
VALGTALVVTVATLVVTTVAPTTVDAAPRHGGPVPSGNSGPPVKMILFGDSVAFSVGFALASTTAQKADDVDFDPQGHLGCGILISQQNRSHGAIASPQPFCNADAPASQQWPAVWQEKVDQFRPDVTVLLAGRWEVVDQMIDGRWMHIGQPAFDRVLKRALGQAVQIGTSRGGLMILETPPCFSSGEQDNGQPWPEDTGARLQAFDTMLRGVAAEHPDTVAIGDLGARMCPQGTFQSVVDGVQIRSTDGVHVPPTAAAGQWLARAIDPEVVRVGRLGQMGRKLTQGPLPGPPG